jgi:DNA-binding CsgD family transcriptional regulator
VAGPVAFVGRERELERLLGALRGDTRLVLVVGDAGVGKTRLAGEAMARAAAAGMVVVRGECLPLAGMLPLLPVASALAELGRLGGGRVLESALVWAPGFARAEAGRLVPQLAAGSGGGGVAERGADWRRERLFAGVAELLAAAAGSGSRLGLLVEDVHWADSETLDFLTFLGRAGRWDAVRVVVTCRSDEAPLGAGVADWLAQVRGAAGVEEIRLGPLSRAEVAGQVAALAGGPVAAGVLDELFARAEGNAFFTEQLVAAALADGADGVAGDGLRIPAGLPARLADVLAARAGRCAGAARAVLEAMAVAGRPTDEDLLGAVTGLDVVAVRRGLAELAAARLLADDAPGGGHRLWHVLLAEAVAGGLLAGARAMLHERTARALAAAGGEALAGEAARHWQAAGRPAGELPARVAAAWAAERVFGYAEAAGHWQRAIGLWPEVPDAASVAGIGLPAVYVRAIDAFRLSGDNKRTSALAEEAYRRFASHADPAIAAVACYRAGVLRSLHAPAAGRPLLEEALRLFEQIPPSAEHAAARLDYALSFLTTADLGIQANASAQLNRALQIAEAAGATAQIPKILSNLGWVALVNGQVEQGQALVYRGRAVAQASQDAGALLRQAVTDSDVLLKLASFGSAAEVARNGLAAAQQAGLGASGAASMLAANAAEALLALGRTDQAAALIGPLTAGPPDPSRYMVHEARAEIDLLRGDLEAASQCRQQITACVGDISDAHSAPEFAQRGAELALCAGRPGDALREVQQVLTMFQAADFTIFCGRLLAAGMRACADLAGQARARRDPQAAQDAADAAEGLAAWVSRVGGAPFTDHPWVATIPAERATWEAERIRLAGDSDPAAWAAAAKTWDGLGCPHRAGYAWWRQAQAQLDSGQPTAAAAVTLRAAAAAADGHEPLLAQVRALAERARIPLHAPPAAPSPSRPAPAETLARYGLTGRELAVLRLLAAGRTNAQIGAELFISPRTAGVHVTNILRKLGVTNRVQAAAIAERAGLLEPRRS